MFICTWYQSHILSRFSLLINFPLNCACKWLRYILEFSYKTILKSFTSFDVLSDYPHGVWIPRPCRKIFQHKITTNINSSRLLIFGCSLDHTPSVIRSRRGMCMNRWTDLTRSLLCRLRNRLWDLSVVLSAKKNY